MTTTITFQWWRADTHKEIPEKHREQLKDSARKRIDEIVDKGFSGGQLLDEIEGIEYRGWWDLTTVNSKET